MPDPRIDQIIQACTGENSFLNTAKRISVDELTQNLARIGELPEQLAPRVATKTQEVKVD